MNRTEIGLNLSSAGICPWLAGRLARNPCETQFPSTPGRATPRLLRPGRPGDASRAYNEVSTANSEPPGRSVGQAGSSHFPAGTPADASHQRVQPPAARRDVSATLLENIFSFEIRHVLLFETIFFSSQIFHQM